MTKKRKQLYWQLPFLLFLIVGTVLIVRQQHAMPYRQNHGMIFGTVYNITYQNDADLQPEIVRELQKVDREFSMFNPRSTVTGFNNTRSCEMSKMFGEVYELAAQVNRETFGAFDITVAPLVNAWGFGFKTRQMPDSSQVRRLMQGVGMRHLTKKKTGGRTLLVSDNPHTMLDFSAIAKGYGSDVVARLLRHKGIKNFMVEIGGEIVTSGMSPKRVPWHIGVTKPTDDSLQQNKELQTVLNVTDKAMATSGNYRNFYYKGGRKYAHTIDPRTGYPVQHNILSATVLAADCATADAYATSFMVLGLDGAKKVLEKHPRLMAYLIYSDANGRNAVWFSPSLKDKIMQ